MNQRLLSSLAATLLVSTIGVAPSSIASELVFQDEQLKDNVSSADEDLDDLPIQVDASEDVEIEGESRGDRPVASDQDFASSAVAQPSSQVASEATSRQPQAEEAVKVGEYQSQGEPVADTSIAEIYAHEMDGRPAATLYVSGIPVLTFVGDVATAQESSESLDAAAEVKSSSGSGAASGVKVASSGLKTSTTAERESSLGAASTGAGAEESSLRTAANGASAEAAGEANPVWRATAIAARINQLHRSGVDADDIMAEWDADAEAFVITVGDDVLLEFDDNTMLPDTTENSAEDVLQATNRIRRLMGGAEPLSEVEGAPQAIAAAPQVSFGGAQFTFSGMASWYGPGFHGRRSASGEVFNQNALTAAHRSLPFGTLVRVTNTNTGASVTVRINDRGPYSHGRVIDLSAAAARAIGLIHAGVARVQVDVIEPTQQSSR